MALWIAAAGCAVRLCILGVGMWRLRQCRLESVPVHPLPAAFVWAQDAVGARAELRASSLSAGGATFGVGRPVILVAPGFAQLGEEDQRAVSVHELLHVRRGDWLAGLVESAAFSPLWFHPLAWWLERRLRLCREELVDRESVSLTRSRDTYVDALLRCAESARLLPAPSFRRRGGLARRIQSLYQEVPSMSKLRLILSSTFAAGALGVAVHLAVAQFPLVAAPQLTGAGADPTTVQALVYQHPVAYPIAARKAGIEGAVVVEAVVAQDGAVADARVLSGPEELRKAALESVLQWQYRNESRERKVVQATIQFRREDGVAEVGNRITEIRVSNSLGPAGELLRSRLAPYQGAAALGATLAEIRALVRPFGVDAAAHVQGDGSATNTILVVGSVAELVGGARAPEGPRLRVGGNVQSKKKVGGDAPRYPAEARAARAQGTVRFDVLIGQDGRVKSLALVSGDPLLTHAAQAAVSTWVWEPTLLNGSPVEVLTTVDVNFTLRP
jgi:TonB family protein